MADAGFEETEAVLAEMEKKVNNVYRIAVKESQEKLKNFLEKFEAEDLKKKAAVEAGKITEEAYMKWRLSKMASGKRYQAMLDTLAADFANADKIAMSIVGVHMPEVYAINRNFAAFEVEKGSMMDTSFTLYDRHTTERLIKDNAIQLPKPKVDIPKDKQWNRRHIREQITQGILQGEAIPSIAKRLEKVTDMDHSAAIRNARTATTGAQNLGRTDSYKRAEAMGIKLQQEWLATLDGRTRHSHRQLDGVKIKVGGKFPNGCRYPGDPEGPPEEVYNCRCTLVAALDSLDQSNAPRISKLGDMTYEEWKNEHKKRETRTLTSDYTGIGSEFKFNDYMLKNHPEAMGSMGYVNKDVESTYNRRFHLQKSVYENDPEYGIKEVSMSEYLKMSWQDQSMSFPDFESYKKYILSKEAQDFAEPGSIMDGLRRYNLGATADGYGKGKGARLAFDKEYGLSDFITSHTDVHYTGDTLYRGVKSNKAGIKELQKAMDSGEAINMRGISSWSTSKHVANEFTQLSLRGSKSSTPLVFVEEGMHTRNAMPFPYSSRGLLVQSEVVYSGDATFSILKMEERDGCWYVYVREN